MIRKIVLALTLSLGTAAILTGGQAFAHAALKSSSPKSGAAVAAPKTLSLEFEHPTRLTKVKLTTGDKEVPVTADTSAPAATTFAVPLPALAPGKYEVKWAAMGADGHPMTGGFSFTVTGK